MGGEQRPVAVGVDGAEAGARAIAWALADARTRRAPVRLVHVCQVPVADGWSQPLDYEPSSLTAAAAAVLDEALADVRGRVSDMSVTGVTAEGDRVRVLVAESEHAEVLVVGARGLGRLTGAVLGSVSSAVAGRAACPVVVVRGMDGYPEGHVVVGVDGGEEADAVLEFAFDHASRHQLPLRAVLCRRPAAAGLLERARPEPQAGGDRARATAAMSEAMAGWQDKYPDVPVERQVIDGHPVEVLLEASLRAHLLVVGARGPHALPGTLLGSVSQGVLHHATAPVAVVRAGVRAGR